MTPSEIKYTQDKLATAIADAKFYKERGGYLESLDLEEYIIKELTKELKNANQKIPYNCRFEYSEEFIGGKRIIYELK